MIFKRTYVWLILRTRLILEGLGIFSSTQSDPPGSTLGTWARSLFAIYDFEELAKLDIPWWTFKASKKVGDFLDANPQARVFEWGSGASTLWLAKRAKSVVAVEHDPNWAERVGEASPPNARVRLVKSAIAQSPGQSVVSSSKPGYRGEDFSDYVSAIEAEDESFDLIVIDGRARESCMNRALDFLAVGGIVVFDNVDRLRYKRAIVALSSEFRVEWTRGLTPCLPYPTSTAIISKIGLDKI